MTSGIVASVTHTPQQTIHYELVQCVSCRRMLSGPDAGRRQTSVRQDVQHGICPICEAVQWELTRIQRPSWPPFAVRFPLQARLLVPLINFYAGIDRLDRAGRRRAQPQLQGAA